MNITPETRGVWWPGNFLKAPLPEPVPNGSKRSRNNQDYKSKRDEFEVEDKRHVESRIQNQNNDALMMGRVRIALTPRVQRQQNTTIESCPVHTRVVSQLHLRTVIYLLIVPLCPVALPSCI